MPRELVEKVDNIQKQVGNASRKLKTKKESKINDAIISKLYMSKEKTIDLEDMSIDTLIS